MQSPALADIGAIVREAREAKGWSRATLANQAGVSSGTISNLELYGTAPRLDTLLAITEALGLELTATPDAAASG